MRWWLSRNPYDKSRKPEAPRVVANDGRGDQERVRILDIGERWHVPESVAAASK